MPDYIRDANEIYRNSFAIIRSEANLDVLPSDVAKVAVRLIHACGMTDIVTDLGYSPTAVQSARAALAAGAPILCDCRMVADGVTRRRLSANNQVICTLNEPKVPEIAQCMGTTRSAAALELWRSHLEGAVIAIGNAPTALFRLLEMLDEGAHKPAIILGFPVGFVGAAESKAALAADSRNVPFLTLHGRRGGSAIAAAAVNALATGGRMNMKTKGRLYGIGVGPGDPELLTLKALRLLRAAPVVAYQSATDKKSIARAIVAQYLPGNQIEVLFHLPRALEPEKAKSIYDKEIEPIADHLADGRDVVVLCEGDPFFYGSFMYLFTRLSDQYETEVVPGVSSLMACPVALGVPFTYYTDILTVLPAPLPAEELTTHLLMTDAAAIMKLGRHFTKVRDILHKLGLASRARYIERASTPQQRIVPLDEVDPAEVPYFSMIVIPSKNRL